MRRLPLFVLALVACQNAAANDLEIPAFEPFDVPAGPGSAQPHFATAANGTVFLSWTEPAGDGHALRFASYDGRAWSAVRTAAQGRHWFVNWADFPSILPLADGSLVAHWLQRSGPGTYAYDVMIAHSTDRGSTWSSGFRPHRDGTQTEHGFVSLFPVGNSVGGVWLDGRKFAAAADQGHGAGHGDPTKEMTLRFAVFDAAGNLSQEALLDDRACDCCQTAVAVTSKGPIVAYRDRSPEEIRDISVTRLVNGRWTPPRTLHADNWKIPGCPVNGPQADAIGDNVAIAWFAAPADAPTVKVAFSTNAGASFAAPIRIDEGNAMGRVDLTMLDDGRAFVVWLERARDGAEVRGRLVSRNGKLGTARVFGSVTAQRASGFPRMTRRGDQVFLAWNEPGQPSGRIRAARITLR